MHLALGKLIADARVFWLEFGKHTPQTGVLCTNLVRVAQILCETIALGECDVELTIGSPKGADEVGALDRVGVSLAAESPAGLWQIVKALGDLLSLGAERGCACVEVVYPLQLAHRQRLELGAQRMDTVSQFV
jgi:hypothetical protein